jgi:hypothetical protein
VSLIKNSKLATIMSTYILHLWLKFQSFFLFFLEQHKCNTPRFWPCPQVFYLILLDGQFRNLINRSIMAIMNWKAVHLLSVFGFSHMQMPTTERKRSWKRHVTFNPLCVFHACMCHQLQRSDPRKLLSRIRSLLQTQKFLKSKDLHAC